MMVRRQLLNTVVRDLFSFLVASAWWNFDCDIAVECLDCEVCSQHSLADVQIQVCVDVRTFSLEVAVIAHLNVDYQVAMWACLTCMAFLGHSKVDSIVDTLRNVNCLLGGAMSGSLATAGHTRVSDYFTHTVTVATDLLNHNLVSMVFHKIHSSLYLTNGKLAHSVNRLVLI